MIMVRNIILGALAGSAIAAAAYMLAEKKNRKSIEKSYHQLGEYLQQVRHKMMDKFEKGKGQAECLGERAGKMVHGYIKN